MIKKLKTLIKNRLKFTTRFSTIHIKCRVIKLITAPEQIRSGTSLLGLLLLLAFHSVEVSIYLIDVSRSIGPLAGLAGSVGANKLHFILLKTWLDSAIFVSNEETIFHSLLDLGPHLMSILKLLLELGNLSLLSGIIGKRIRNLSSLTLSLSLVRFDLLFGSPLLG